MDHATDLFEGDAVEWFRNRSPFDSWTALSQALREAYTTDSDTGTWRKIYAAAHDSRTSRVKIYEIFEISCANHNLRQVLFKRVIYVLFKLGPHPSLKY